MSRPRRGRPRPGRATRQAAALLAFVLAAAGTLATTLAYAALDGEWTDSVSLGPGEEAVLRRLSVTVTAQALPPTEGLLSGGTYGRVVAAFPEVPSLEVAIIDASGPRPQFESAGEHVLLDAASCQFEQDCRRVVDVVIRLPGATAPTVVDWSIRSGVYVPGGQLPDGAALAIGGLDAPPIHVGVHELTAEADGRVEVGRDGPVEISVRYAPAGGTQVRLHGLTAVVAYDGRGPAATGDATGATVELARVGGGDAESIPLDAGGSATRELEPLATCLAGCQVSYRLAFASADVADPGGDALPAGTATWRVSGWLFVLSDPGGGAPAFEIRGPQPGPDDGGEGD